MPLVVHFKKPGDWRDSVNIHYWDTGPAIPQTAWPGVPMTAEGDDWFSHAFETAETASLVFNDGAGRQTGNLRRDQQGWYYRNNQWYDANPERPLAPVITIAPPARTYLTPQQVVLQGSNRTDVIHYTTDGTTPTASSPVYTGPIEIARPTTLMAFGVNSAGDVGGISTFLYTIDPDADLERPSARPLPRASTAAPTKTLSPWCLPSATTGPRRSWPISPRMAQRRRRPRRSTRGATPRAG